MALYVEQPSALFFTYEIKIVLYLEKYDNDHSIKFSKSMNTKIFLM